MMISIVGVSVGGGARVSVGVGEGTVGMGRLRLRVMRFFTSALSPMRVNCNEMIPFGIFSTFHEYSNPSFTGLLLSLRTVHETG
jgi:hypothetical protein